MGAGRGTYSRITRLQLSKMTRDLNQLSRLTEGPRSSSHVCLVNNWTTSRVIAHSIFASVRHQVRSWLWPLPEGDFGRCLDRRVLMKNPTPPWHLDSFIEETCLPLSDLFFCGWTIFRANSGLHVTERRPQAVIHETNMTTLYREEWFL